MVANITEVLSEAKVEVEAKFKDLEARRQSLVQAQAKIQAEINGLLPELARLQGEYRQLEALQKRLNST